MSDSGKAVFLSYASQDAEAARKICEALRSAGVEVWFDTDGGLEHGDEWDTKIRKQIKECVLFIPIISANTQARHEGYFRIEWELAAQRAMGIASGVPFILPVVVDETGEPGALVPDRFRAVQWTRLPGGVVPAEVKARFLKLWSHRVGALKGMAAEVAPVSDWRASGENTIPAGRRSALLRRGLVAGIIVAAVGIGVWWTSSSRSKPNPSTIASTAASSGVTEAQMLVTKARQILDEGDEVNRETYALAEDLLKRAVALDPANAVAWATYADLSYFLAWHALDPSDSRKEEMRRQAERARTLAPDSPEAIIVSADIGALLRQDLPGLERQMLALTKRLPGNWRAYRALGNIYRFMGRTDDSIRALQRAYEVSNGLPRMSADLLNVLTRRDRWLEAEPILAQALQKGAVGRILWYDVVLRVYWRGDVVGAEAALASWPGWLLLEDRGAFQAWQAWFLGRQPDKALAAIQQVPHDYLSDYSSTGPRAAFSARAHEMAGHVEAARTDWQTAIQVCDRVLATSPQSGPALYWKAWALARLGDLPAAGAICTQMQQRGLLSPAGASVWGGMNIIPALWATIGRPEEALVELAKPRAPDDGRPAVTRAMLELDPAYDSLRDDPRFRKVLEQAIAPPAADLTKLSAAGPAKADGKSVAVLAFANLSDDKDNEYFSDGISEELLNVLARVPGLKVSARTSAFSFKGKGVAIPEIARQLGVAYVVEGSVRKVGSRVRITAQLIKASDGFHVWSDNFDRELKDIFAVQDEIAGLIATKLSLSLGATTEPKRAVNPEVYRLYLEARQAWNRRNLAGYDRAESLLNQALVLEPDFARAHAALSDVWLTRAQDDPLSSVGAFALKSSPLLSRIIAVAEKAVALDGSLAEAHASLGSALRHAWRMADAERELRRAVVLNPNYATGRQWLGRQLMSDGRIDEALAELQQAVELDPLSPRIADNYSICLINAGRAREALLFAERALALQPDSIQALGFRSIALAMLDRGSEAADVARKIPEGVWDGHRAFVLARGGLRAEAEQASKRPITSANLVTRAAALAALGRHEECLAMLEPNTIPIQLVDFLFYWPVFDPLRKDPRFLKVIEDIGMTQPYERAQAWRASSAKPTAAKAANQGTTNQRPEDRGPASVPAELRRGEQRTDKKEAAK